MKDGLCVSSSKLFFKFEVVLFFVCFLFSVLCSLFLFMFYVFVCVFCVFVCVCVGGGMCVCVCVCVCVCSG